MKLSLCIATFNEEKNLHYPLDSAIDLVDEVIIVDGSSTDKTVEVAKSYGKKVKIYVEDNPQIFHINKQKALDRAKGDWILQLDADEALSEDLKQEISNLLGIKNHESRSKDHNSKFILHNSGNEVAFWLPRKNFFLTRFLTKGGQYPDYTIRLYKRGVAHFPCKTVHENVEIDTKSISIPSDPELVEGESRDLQNYIGYLKNPLLHYADPNFQRYLTRWNRYTSLDARLIIERSEKVGFFSYFFVKPTGWFLRTYVRHKGFMDGFPGFVFALFSSIRFWAIYVKVWVIKQKNRQY